MMSPEYKTAAVDEKTVAINNFIETTWNFSAQDLKQYPLHERALLLRSKLVSDEEIDFYAGLKDSIQDFPPQSRGVALIKPELGQAHDSVHDFFADLGTNPRILPTMHLSHEQWMSVYADRIKDFPEIMFLYVTQRALGLTPVLFDYPSVQHYEERGVDPAILQFTDPNDLAELFDTAYCGRAFIETPGTIRWEVVRPALEASEFTTMNGFAAAFDPFEHFRNTSPRVIFGSFNGIHLPDNSRECVANMKTLFGDQVV